MSDPGEQMLSIREVCTFFGGKERPLDPSTVYRWVRAGTLPRAIRLSAFNHRWRRSDCQAVLDAMAANSQPSVIA